MDVQKKTLDCKWLLNCWIPGHQPTPGLTGLVRVDHEKASATELYFQFFLVFN